LRVAAQICDDVMVLKNGQIAEAGPAAQVLSQPRSAYTRQLIEAIPGRQLLQFSDDPYRSDPGHRSPAMPIFDPKETT
jgi:ABC-type dipeptide/oligopeptide/nickel transport system ATPase component